MMQEIDGIPVYMLILIVIVLLAQGTWLFLDARKREANAWFWGIWGCIQTPMPLIFYWIVVRRKRKANFTKV